MRLWRMKFFLSHPSLLVFIHCLIVCLSSQSENQTMATIPMFNPNIPFLGEIPGGMAIGKKLHIRGQILNSDGMFNINIQSGGAVQPRDDTPLHISIRISDRVVVLNSFEGGAWQQEERHSGRPVREGENLDLMIKAKDEYFKIEINGKKLGKFEHRLPLEMARYVHIGEGAVIESITESW